MKDFIIVGGGIAGVSAAARLAELGSVTVLEQESALGHHASGRSAALFEANYGASATIALNHASEAEHKEIGTLTPRGMMLVGKDGDENFDAEAKAMGVTHITPSEAAQHWPNLAPDVTRIAYHSDAWDIDTDLLLQTYGKIARAAGATLVTGAPVTRITRTSTGWQIHCQDQTHEARVLINAAGAWADGVAQMAGLAPMGITPYRRSMARIPTPDGVDLRKAPMLMGYGEAWYAKPDAGALIVSPAEEEPTTPHDAWAEDMTLAEGLARYEEFVTTPVTRMLANWAGLRSFSPDRNMVLGRDPAEPAFVWCAGQGGYGMQSSPAVARLLTDMMAERTPQMDPEVMAMIAPERFAPK